MTSRNRYAPRLCRAVMITGALAVVIICAGTGCVQTRTTVTRYDGGRPIGEHVYTQFLYGKVSHECGLFADSIVSNLDVGFANLANLIRSLIAAYIAGDVAKVQEVKYQIQAKGVSEAKLAQIDAQAKAAADQIKAGVVKQGLKIPGAQVQPYALPKF